MRRPSELRINIGGAPLAAAAGGTRITISDYQALWNFLFREYDATVRRGVLWDFRAGSAIADWRPEMQSYQLPGPTRAVTEPFAFAISPDGRYVAEGGDGILRRYKVEP
jgi:hypothetical protein